MKLRGHKHSDHNTGDYGDKNMNQGVKEPKERWVNSGGTREQKGLGVI